MRKTLIIGTIAALASMVLGAAPAAIAVQENPAAQIEVGGASYNIALSPDGDRLYVPLYSGTAGGSLAVIDTSRNVLAAQVPVGQTPFTTVVSADGRRVYVADQRGNAVRVVDAATLAVIASAPVQGATVMALHPTLPRLFVATGRPGAIAVVDTSTNQVLQRIELGGYVVGITLSQDGRYLYASNLDFSRMDVIEAATSEVVAQVPTGATPTKPIPTRGNRYVLVSNFAADTVTVIDGRSYQVVRTIKVGNAPTPAVVDPAGKWAWVGNSADSTATKIDLTKVRGTGDPTPLTVKTGFKPWMLRLNAKGTTLFVANQESNFLSAICTKGGRNAGILAASSPNNWLIGGPYLYAGGVSESVFAFTASTLSTDRCS